MNARNLMMALALCACAMNNNENIGTSSARLDLPTATPVPIDTNGNASFDGTSLELMVADAWASCSFESTLSPGFAGPTTSIRLPTATDFYLTYIQSKMDGAICASAALEIDTPQTYAQDNNTLHRWFLERADPTCNADPNTIGTGSVTNEAAQLDRVAMPGYLDTSITSPTPLQQQADAIVRAAGINYCIAQHLQQIAPGSAGANALTMTADDQREILEIIRERTQLAMLQYARLAFLAATPTNGSTATLQLIQTWFNTTNAATITEVGDALAASEQLLSVVSAELQQLLGRSASARDPRGGGTDLTEAQDMWWVGSWRGRAMALLYGGDPLDNTVYDQYGNPTADSTVPWPHYTENTEFPAIPFVSTDVRAPQVEELLLLAQQFDAVSLKKQPTKDSNGCYQVDATASASRLYRAIEAGLETANCTVVQNQICQTVTPESLPDPSTGYTNMALWTDHRIDYGQTGTLISLLSDEIGRECEYLNQGNGTLTPYEIEGGVNVLGSESIVTLTGQDAGDYYHVAGNNGRFFGHFMVEQFEGLLGSNAAYGVNTIVYPDATPEPQGYFYTTQNTSLEQWRLVGVVPAFIALRETLYQAQQLAINNTPSSNVQTLLKRTTNLMDVAGSTAGNTSYMLERPRNEYADTNHMAGVNQSQPLSLVVYSDATDPFWDPSTPTLLLHVFPYTLFANKFPATTTALIPRIMIDTTTQTFSGLNLQNALAEQLVPPTPATPPTATTGLHTNLNRWVFNNVPNVSATYAVEKIVNGQSQYKLLLGNALVNEAGNEPSLYGGLGGVLNTAMVSLITPQRLNPSQPQYDAFGYPVRWVPPTDPTLVGNAPGTPATTAYLTSAQTASDSAVAAVTIAFQTLLDETKQGLDQNTQIAKSQEVATASKQGLCGEQNPDCASCAQDDPSCDVALVPYNLVPTSTSDPLRSNFNQLNTNCQASDQLACVAVALYKQFDVQIQLDRVVANGLMPSNNQTPSFDAYSGGSLQATFIQQWSSVKNLQNELTQFYAAYGAAYAQEAAAAAAVAAASTKQQDNCGVAAMAGAALSCVSLSAGFATASVSVNVGPVIAQMHACTAATADLQAAQAQPILAFAQGVSSMLDEGVTLANASTQVQLALAQANQTTEQAKLTQDQANLDVSLAADDEVANTLLYQRYHEYDVWRAQALLENARRYAVTARRAIESRYAVDMSIMAQAEPFVASPALWADGVYEYDLNMPAAVGLSIAPQQTTGSIYPNVVADYVANLQRFVDGFAIARPSASTQSDSDVLSLPGPTGLQTEGTLPEGVIDSSAYKWSFFCPDTASWLQIPSSNDINAVCSPGNAPTLARLDFMLDPWARVDGSIADDPYNNRYNERWGRVALNLVGTAILDCTKASDPLSCYAESFIPYDFTHNGPGWVTDYNESWQYLFVSTGQVESGKALTAEQWLDPLSNGWSQPYVSAVARTEFSERPFGGAYVITLHLGPEVTLSRIERLQLLVESSYWVKQQ